MRISMMVALMMGLDVNSPAVFASTIESSLRLQALAAAGKYEIQV
jgi:hypothetical protein